MVSLLAVTNHMSFLQHCGIVCGGSGLKVQTLKTKLVPWRMVGFHVAHKVGIEQEGEG